MSYEYKAELIRVVDGDTIRLKLSKDINVGFYITQTISTEMNFRLAGIDTPEVRGRNKKRGLEVKQHVEDILTAADSMRAVTHKPDKYGRWLVDLFVSASGDNSVEFSLADHLIALGMGVPYFGGKKKK